MSTKGNLLATAVCLALLGTSAQAAVDISGFGQIVVGQAGGDAPTFPDTTYDDDIDWKNESIFGIQVNASLNDTISAVAQVVATGADDFDADFAWAYLNFNFESGFGMKIGRQRLAFYRYSDYLDVGYAYPWVRPPSSVYTAALRNVDGISVNYARNFGKWNSYAQILYGGFEGDVRYLGAVQQQKTENLVSLVWELDYDSWALLRMSYHTPTNAVRGVNLDTLVDALIADGRPELASLLATDGDRAKFYQISGQVDWQNWFALAEFTSRKRANAAHFSDKKDWYASVGYHAGAWTPTLTYGHRSGDPKLEFLDNFATTDPFYNRVRSAILKDELDDSYISAGLRWDFLSNTALKLDYTRFSSDISTRLDAHLISAGVVFSF
ncbi:MAG: hypothetical protein R3F04_04020 [Lysobacteraceae bacterium]